MELSGKVALITGATSGIGRASAFRLASEGASIGVLGHSRNDVDDTVTALIAAGGKALGLMADVADEAAMKTALDTLIAHFGRLDIVLANAGINGVWAPIDDLQPAEWDRTIAVNLRGTYLTLHYAVPHLKTQGAGSIVVVSSINGTRTFTNAGATAYSATKAAQIAVVQHLALELAKYRIRVNAVCPGGVVTHISESTVKRNQQEAAVSIVWPKGSVPLNNGQPGSADDIAESVLFLASERSRHITGTSIFIDGGQGLLT
ncbi:SDR family oxidoreductase [Rhizobium leucaenae]|uniref:NAD(P)-dependent dehydrogenase (Short-subunit alcohol dehydrogenase family) n=1 Tax=Rhizobium leucaenae TaxID=29450 RepID=A0A7W6ZQ70_9HYPH|nr:SDR family NAD(P)-dependent oxidoreductase [Rhizobium leucaenae]MBB4566696.1 NAD(P)-dependent dehydrogenase (short-subunit alcohol dehydrogenase family) [Rhizobium leucaenae]MBB6301409.1 NAD(P)-dependent dehydrogenase (short-subunit alcohol dehydrogenase family) [Rhizobium leucaenae]